MQRPVIVAITGASGVIYGVETLRALRDLNVPTRLVISQAGLRTLALETDFTPDTVTALATETYAEDDIAAPIASGSHPVRGMIVAPCSVKTLSAIAHSYAANLIVRAADVTLKERRPLVLLVRETPLHKGHLELMARAADLGAVILPPMPAFYHQPRTITDIVRQSVGKTLDILGIEHRLYVRWGERTAQPFVE